MSDSSNLPGDLPADQHAAGLSLQGHLEDGEAMSRVVLVGVVAFVAGAVCLDVICQWLERR